jgi:hypothetical protein
MPLWITHLNSLSVFHSDLAALSSSPTSIDVPASQNLSSEHPSFQRCLPSLFHSFFYPCYVKSSSWTFFLCSSNPGICGQIHYSCIISWCYNEQQCVLLDHISNTLWCYKIFHCISFHKIYIQNICDHIHYMNNNAHEKYFHTFALVSQG